MARVLVTGATGCLGGRLTLDLLHAGEEVIAQGRNPALMAPLAKAGARPLLADLRGDLAPEALKGVETIYHCAALSTAWGPRAEFFAINVTATRKLLALARGAGTSRFVFASSPSIYANGQDRLNLGEEAALPRKFASPYAQTKYLAEQEVLAADDPAGLRCLALRPRAIYGKGDRSLLPRLLDAIKRGRVPLINSGKSLIDITHVSDAAQAMMLAAKSDQGGRVYNITSGEAYSFKALLDEITVQMAAKPRRIKLSFPLAMTLAKGLEAAHGLFAPHREPILTRQAVSSLGRSLTLDISRARAELGYAPQVKLPEGIRDYADVF